MDPFTTAAVLSAVNTATSGMLSGAAAEAGRRTTERLAALARRIRGRDADDADDADGTAHPPTVPTDPAARRDLAERLFEQARREPAFARDLIAWLRETDLLRDTTGPVCATAARPRLLPPGTAAFTDREPVRRAIAALLDDPAASAAGAPRIVVLTGPGGVGKTATAVHFARAFADRFPDGQLYADLRGASPATAAGPSATLVRFLHGLGVPADRVPATEQEQADLYRHRTADRRLVVLLDNAHSAAQVAPLLTAAPGSLTLVTSRHGLPELVRDHGARVLHLGPLSGDDAVLLLTRIAGLEPAGAQRAHAEAVAARCGGMPLALCETGALAAGRDGVDWERLEREFASRGPEPAAPAPADPTLLATDVAYRALAPAAARLYRLLGLCPWPAVPVGAAAAAADIGPAEARALLGDLVGARLLEEAADGRYRFHDVVRRHAESRAHEEDGRAAARDSVERVIGWYLDFAVAADYRVITARWHLGPGYGRLPRPAASAEAARAALEELSRERENLAEAVRAAEEHGFDGLTWQLCEAMWALHLRLGFHEQWVATHVRGVAAARRCATSEPRAEGRMRSQLAFAYMGLGRLADAERELDAAAAADRAAGHHRGHASAVESLGLLFLRQWRYAEAEERFRQARRIWDEVAPGDDGEKDAPRALALLEHHLGRALAGQGRFPEAVGQLWHALGCFHTLPERDSYNEARVRMSLGETLLAAGDPAGARVPLDEAISVMSAEGATLQLADALELRARCGGDSAGFLRRARELYVSLGDVSGVARVGVRLGGAG
ncbi:tetratricopeptide repeat protein [Streptomyces sp. NPDC051173]|uniref:tetratricopeptide repeat protein n=1 Tax=Streptomyces sp. NPDC051173 TaxID=3155164 RepID=UPI00344B513A